MRIARDNGNFVEIATGLTPGERVALNLSNQIDNGDKVAASNGRSATNDRPAPTKTR